LYVLSQARERQGKLEEAILALEKGIGLLDAGVERARFYYAQGRLHERMADLPKAEVAYEDAAASASDAWAGRSARRQLLLIYKNTGKLQRLVDDYEERLKKNPDDEEALEGMVQLYSQIDRDAKKALPYCERLAAKRPDDARLLRDMAVLYGEVGRVQEATAIYERLAKDSPRSQAYHLEQSARLLARSGKPDEALALGKRIVEAAPEQASSHASYAAVCVRAGRYRDAIVAFEKAVALAERENDRDELRLKLARTLGMAGESEKAEAICKEIAARSQAEDVRRHAQHVLRRIQASKGRDAGVSPSENKGSKGEGQ
jgi:tetratricopeptide (TPR) repeat protein